MCLFPQSLAVAIQETMIHVKQLFYPLERLERDQAYDPIVHTPRLLIVELLIFLDVISWDDQEDFGEVRIII